MPETTDTAATTRRTLLAGAGAESLLAAAAACGSGSGSTSGSSNGNGNANPGDGSVAKASAIPVGGGEIFADQKVVVTQPTAGTYKAFSAVCTHQGCTVSSVSNGIIQCPCHGSQYSIVDGSVKSGPAPRPLPAKTATVKNGEIFVS